MNLQMFAETIQGKQIVYLFRPLSKATTKDATLMAFTTENERSVSKDASTKATKSGTIRTPGTTEIEITASAAVIKGDTLMDDLEKAMKENELIECWEVNRAEQGTGENASKYKATYYQGYLTSLSMSSPSDDTVTYSITYGANGEGASGYATLSADQEEAANYVFADTVKK